MYQAYIPFDFDDSYFETAPAPSSLSTPAASSSQLVVSHRESFERYANPSTSTSAAGPSTSHQTIPRQCYTVPTPGEYPPAAEEFYDAEPGGFHEVVPAMPQPNTLQYQLTTINPAATPFHLYPAYNPYQPVPVPPSTTPAYQLTAIDLAPTLSLPDPMPPLNIVQYEPSAVVPGATALPPDAAYNPAVRAAEETLDQTAKGPEIASSGSQSASANGLRWKHPIVPTHPPPPQVAHAPTQGKSQPPSSKGRRKRKQGSHHVSAGEEEHGFETGTPVMTPSQPGETVMADWEFRNILGRPAKKQKRIPVDQSVPIPGRYCRGCGINFSRSDGLKRHQAREKCGIENAPVTAIVTGDTGMIVQMGPDGGKNGKATISAVEYNTMVPPPATTAKKNTGRRGRGNPRKRKVGEQDGHLSGPMVNSDSTPLFVPGQVSSTEVAEIGKKGQAVEQESDSTPTNSQAVYEPALPVGTAMPYYGQCGGAAYPTLMASSHPSYGPPIGSDRQQYYPSITDQSAHAGTYLACATQDLNGPATLAAMTAPQEPGFYHGERRAESYYQGQPSQCILSADSSSHTQGVYYMQPTNAYSPPSTSQHTVSDVRYPLTYHGHIRRPYPQQARPDVQQSQTSFPLQQPGQYITSGDQLRHFSRSFRCPDQEVLVDASHYQTQIEYQSSDRLYDSTNTRAARESDPTLGQPPSRQQTREGRAVSRLGSDNISNVGSENTHPVNRRPSVPKLKQSTPLEGQLSTSSVLVSSKSGQGNSHNALVGTVPLSVIALPKIFSSPEKSTLAKGINDADSDDDSLFTDRGSSPL